MKVIYKDKAGNKLISNGNRYWAKNTKGEIMSKHGLYSMLREKGISTKGEEIYVGKKAKPKTATKSDNSNTLGINFNRF